MFKLWIVIVPLLVGVFGAGENCNAQAPLFPAKGTEWQRWLPPPSTLPSGQPETQAKLLSRLSNLLSGDPSRGVNPPNLTDAEVQSLKDAMKQFGGNLPDGLSPDILDSIPPEMISKALSNPELIRQAKEMADQYLNRDRPEENGKRSKSDENLKPKNSSSPRLQENLTETNQKPTSPKSNSQQQSLESTVETNPSTRAKDGSTTEDKLKQNDFKELMNKLLKTQEQFNQRDKSADNKTADDNSEAKERKNATSKESSKPTEDDDADALFEKEVREQQLSPSSSQSAKSNPLQSGAVNSNKGAPQNGSSNSGSSQTGIARSKSSTSGESPSPTLPRSRTGSPTAPVNDGRLNPSSTPPKRSGATPITSRADSSAGDSRSKPGPTSSGAQAVPFSNSAGGRSSAGGGNTAATKEMSKEDIRKEIDRKGFWQTLQKTIEDARANAMVPSPQKGVEGIDTSKSASKKSTESSSPNPSPNSTNRLPTANSLNKTATPSTPQPETDFSKGIKRAGNYLNNLWTQISRSSERATNASSTPSAPSQASPGLESINVPNPFDSSTLALLAVIASVGAMGFFALRYRVHTEKAKREMQHAQLAPKIDEIQTREDLVHAFHALAKKRFQAAQSWWTSGYVTQQFETKIPQHRGPMQTLSLIYDQARYYPIEHQLTAKQIDDAKLALKQCEG